MSPKITIGRLDDGSLLQFTVEQLAEKHLAIEGRIGQRKTLFLLTLLKQYLRLLHHVVIYIDLGGDLAAAWILKEAAEQAGKPFYFFSLGAHDGCSWDPVLNTPAFQDDVSVAVAGLAQGLRLEHGEGYGKTFWSRLSTRDIAQAFNHLAAAGIPLPTFQQLAEELSRMAESARSAQQTSEAYLAAEQLLRFQSLSGQRPQQLYLGNAIEEGAVVVLYLPAAHHVGAARAVASLAAWCTTVEASFRFEQGLEERIIHLAIDEFPQIAAARSAVDATLTMARKWSIQAYPVLQDIEQLKTPDGDAGAVIKSQCQRVIFTAETERTQTELRFESKDIRRTLEGMSIRNLSASTSTHEFIDPELTRNDILAINGEAMRALGVFKLGDKHRNPIPITIIPPTTKARHKQLKNTPWPRLEITEHVPPSTNGTYTNPTRLTDPGRSDRLVLAKRVLERIQTEEVWQLGNC